MSNTFYTIGHGTHSMGEFIALLAMHGVNSLVDVRSFPSSRHSPQFNQDVMAEALEFSGVVYEHIALLGGRRGKQPVDPTINAGWTHPAFKNYADYAMGSDYAAGIARLVEISQTKTLCYCCAESVPWRCHRLIISNTLAASGYNVLHIMPNGKTLRHELGCYGAQPVLGSHGKLTYPAGAV